MNKVKTFFLCLAGLFASDFASGFIIARAFTSDLGVSAWLSTPIYVLAYLLFAGLVATIVGVATCKFFFLFDVVKNTKRFLIVFIVLSVFQIVMVSIFTSVLWRL